MNLINTLRQRYPYYYTIGKLWKFSLLLVVTVTFFLFLLRPVEIDANLRFDLKLTCLIYGLTAGLTFYMFYSTLNLARTYLIKIKWTLLSELTGLTVLVFIVGVINYFLRNVVSTSYTGFDITDLAEDVVNTYLVGIVPLSALTMLNFFYLINDNENKAWLSNILLEKSKEEAKEKNWEQIEISSTNDRITIDTNALCFVKAEGNYTEFHILYNGSIKKEVKRIPMKLVEEQCEAHKNLVRIHRSYLVNIDYVKSVKGNALGYQINIENYKGHIPVARSYINRFNKIMG